MSDAVGVRYTVLSPVRLALASQSVRQLPDPKLEARGGSAIMSVVIRKGFLGTSRHRSAKLALSSSCTLVRPSSLAGSYHICAAPAGFGPCILSCGWSIVALRQKAVLCDAAIVDPFRVASAWLPIVELSTGLPPRSAELSVTLCPVAASLLFSSLCVAPV